MKSALLVLALAAPSAAQPATTYLCIPEAMASVTQTPNGFTSATHPPGNTRMILSNTSGKWQATIHGRGPTFWDQCASEYFCEASAGFSGAFTRENGSDAFSASWLQGTGKETSMIAAMGKCTKL
jgi:hypothetical protein